MTEKRLQKEALDRALESLPERDRRVLELRYGLRGEEPHTLEHIGRRLGMTRERVRQIEIESLTPRLAPRDRSSLPSTQAAASAEPSKRASEPLPHPCAARSDGPRRGRAGAWRGARPRRQGRRDRRGRGASPRPPGRARGPEQARGIHLEEPALLREAQNRARIRADAVGPLGVRDDRGEARGRDVGR